MTDQALMRTRSSALIRRIHDRASPPLVCGVLNVTPDSFSDGGCWAGANSAIRRGVALAESGAEVIDVGGESTRPGAAAVSLDQELARVIPVVEALASAVDTPISVDTSRPEVMRDAVRAGASMVNDVRALRAEGAVDTVSQLEVAVCLTHMQGAPQSMQDEPRYDDVLLEVETFLGQRLGACLAAGVDARAIVLDPGFGFGKQLRHNLTLLAHLERFQSLGSPLMVGLSRKAMIGQLTHRTVDQRAPGSVAGAVIAAQHGARIVRVHDVAETVDAMAVAHAVMGAH